MTTLPLRPECAPVETSRPMPGRTVRPTREELSRCLGHLLEKVEHRLLKQFPLCVAQEARDNAESAALVAIWEGEAQGMTPSGWRKWLWVVARNAAVTLQRSKRPVPLPDDEAIPSSPSPRDTRDQHAASPARRPHAACRDAFAPRPVPQSLAERSTGRRRLARTGASPRSSGHIPWIATRRGMLPRPPPSGSRLRLSRSAQHALLPPSVPRRARRGGPVRGGCRRGRRAWHVFPERSAGGQPTLPSAAYPSAGRVVSRLRQGAPATTTAAVALSAWASPSLPVAPPASRPQVATPALRTRGPR